MSTKPTGGIHIDAHDRAARVRRARHFGVSDELLREAVRMAGSRVTSNIPPAPAAGNAGARRTH